MGPGRSTERVNLADKTCAVCGRRIEWRKKWERDWDSVRYCSKACRTRKLRAVDEQLEQAIIDLLEHRSGSICPSDAARAVEPEAWHAVMEDTRMAARRLVAGGHVEITQRGRVVDPSTAKGPIRIRRAAPHR
ncbi:MAG: DUF2256 and DUF3253 domain-containing protein [Acidimicrobiia bacterium]|nr:DUF2256 and DUF3253 domain-containing protein [Acidimicrobiia bacterium]